jgi:ABC-2 type transport system ATP-binding protein
MALVLDGLVKRFGKVTALDGISFEVARGSVFGFLGANGAGKTTTMRIVLDIFKPDAGTVHWNGEPAGDAPRETWGYLPEERGLYSRLEVLGQLVFFASLYGIPRDVAAARAREWLARFRIPDYEKRRAEELSKGNQQKVQLIAAILHEPEVLVMDEPFVGLDPVNVALLKEAFEEMRGRGSTLIFSTHQMEMVEELCDSVALIDRGRLVLEGPIRDVKRSTGRRVVRLGVESRGSASSPGGDRGAPDSGRFGDGATAGDGSPRPDLAWVSELRGVHVARPGVDYTELDIDRDVDPESILRAALDRGLRVTHFQIADPSIEQIFIERVGRKPSEDQHLAKGSDQTDGAGSSGSGGDRDTPVGAAS